VDGYGKSYDKQYKGAMNKKNIILKRWKNERVSIHVPESWFCKLWPILNIYFPQEINLV
jgi:hypothetical protein